MAEIKNKSRHCPVCIIDHNEDDPTHNTSPRHKFNYILMLWNKSRKSLVKNRHGVEVTISFTQQPLVHDVNAGKHCCKITPDELLQSENGLDFTCKVTNRRGDDIILTNVALLHPYPWYSLHDPNNNINTGNIIQLAPGKSYVVIIKFAPEQESLVGDYSIPVCFSLQTIEQVQFHIARSINISVQEDLNDKSNLLNGISPFKGTAWNHCIEIYPPTDNVPYSNMYPIPIDTKWFFIFGFQEYPSMRGYDFFVLADLREQMEPGNVTEYNFRNFWHNVLWLEEVGQELGLQQYNMENVPLNLLENDRLELHVPGLAEKRPSVIVGDMVDIRLHDDHTGYRGIIRKVNDATVEIDSVDQELIVIVERSVEMREDFDVKFVLSRLSFERKHQGIEQVVRNDMLRNIFPPHDAQLKPRHTLRTINDGEFLNTTILTNEEQKTAVKNILNATSAPYPYIVFGPPGTGKTVTIVEAILQIKQKTKHNILVCAPSNAACDMITEKLLQHCDTSELLRILSTTVDVKNIHDIVLPYTNYEDGNFRKIDSAILKSYRIVVTTLILIGKYTGYYHPDVVFIDEAAQACEPEVCIALSMIKKDRQIILAGDPQQLGPSLSSDAAKKYGLGISMLERLMQLDLYDRRDPNCITMLIQNYRNHSTILRLPNKMFYGDQLEARSSQAEIDPISRIFVFHKIKGLYKKKKNEVQGQAIEFCSLISKESREGKSPSFYNKKELEMTLKYIKALLALQFDDEDYKVIPTDIGVVTPYTRQVYKIKTHLQYNKIEGVEVGTTETFQGREKRIIIISTVRAQKDLLLYDKLYKLGFVRNEKRFNVAVTRAMSKLIVIGCAHVLATDRKWLNYIELSEELKGFCGAPFAKRTDAVIDEIANKVENVKLDPQYNHL